MGIEMKIDIGGLSLKSPIIMLSGVFGYGDDNIDFVDYSKLGAIVTKTITLQPRQGNPQPRLRETTGGMLNSIGLQNPGIDIFIKEVLPEIKKTGLVIIVSIAGHSPAELSEAASKIGRHKIDAVEINLSCPNVRENNVIISQSSSLTFDAVTAVKKKLQETPVIVKLSPNVTDITEIGVAAEKAGADMLSLINTVQALEIDTVHNRVVRGGLSGPAVKPIGLRCVYDVYRAVNIPVIGFGGVHEGKDMLEYILAGAAAVGVGSGFFSNPHIIDQGYRALSDYISEKGLANISDAVGILNEKKKNRPAARTGGCR